LKILAREGDTLFANLSTEEFAQIQGFRSDYQLKQSTRRTTQAGDIVDVDAWFQSVRAVVENRERLERLREQFRHEVDVLDVALAAIEAQPEIES
jgi:hypothetical protein